MKDKPGPPPAVVRQQRSLLLFVLPLAVWNMILGIDTSTAVASVALVKGGELISEGARRAGHANHTEILLPLIESVLTKASVSLPEVSALAVAIGPGSFTGLRIGLSTVKGLAYGTKIPVLGIPTLLAVAARVTDWQGWICPFLDARKKEVYAALFHRERAGLERLSEDLVAPPVMVIERIQSRGADRCIFIGEGAPLYRDLIRDALGEGGVVTLGENYPSTASAVARLAEERLRREEADPLGPLSPLYVRPPEAELKRGKQDSE